MTMINWLTLYLIFILINSKINADISSKFCVFAIESHSVTQENHAFKTSKARRFSPAKLLAQVLINFRGSAPLSKKEHFLCGISNYHHLSEKFYAFYSQLSMEPKNNFKSK